MNQIRQEFAVFVEELRKEQVANGWRGCSSAEVHQLEQTLRCTLPLAYKLCDQPEDTPVFCVNTWDQQPSQALPSIMAWLPRTESGSALRHRLPEAPRRRSDHHVVRNSRRGSVEWTPDDDLPGEV